MQLLLGCGYSRMKRMGMVGRDYWQDLVTVDHNHNCEPDVVHDLKDIPLPFAENSASEIHAYHVLEHLGLNGDYNFFFDQFSDFWRILKPNGCFFGICPSYKSLWSYGDPGHTRVINSGSLVFLSQKEYKNQIDIQNRGMSDYRNIYKADFDILSVCENDHEIRFVLKAVK